MSTINQQCQYCQQTTSVEVIDDGKNDYDWVADGDCGCERENSDRSFDDYDDD